MRPFAAVRGGQLRGGLAHRHLLAAHDPAVRGDSHLRHPPDPWQLHLRVDGDQSGGQGVRRACGVRGRPSVHPHVPALVPHLPCDAAAQQALHRRLVTQHRGAEPHPLRHQVRAEDSDDHLPGHRAPGLHADFVDHRRMVVASLRTVRHWSSYWEGLGKAVKSRKKGKKVEFMGEERTLRSLFFLEMCSIKRDECEQKYRTLIFKYTILAYVCKLMGPFLLETLM